VYGNTAVTIPLEEQIDGHTHRWTVCVRSAASPAPTASHKRGNEQLPIGGADDMSYFIKKVTFKLHETYPNPTRTIEKPPYEVTETGWGEFEIQIRIFFVSEASEKPLTIHHHLKLHPWPASSHFGPNNMVAGPAGPISKPPAPATIGTPAPVPPTSGEAGEPVSEAQGTFAASGEATAEAEMKPDGETEATPNEPLSPAVPTSPVHAYQYDEIVFLDPTEAFYETLIQNPPTPLPKTPRLPKPDSAVPLGVGGNIGELTLQTESHEGARLDEARLKILAEVEQWRARLIANEHQLSEMRKELETAV